MRFKTGLIVGLAVGYYYGAKAGRERYQQMDHYLAQMRASDAYQDLRSRLDGVVDQSVGRARNALNDVAFGGHSPSSTSGPTPFDYTGDPTLN